MFNKLFSKLCIATLFYALAAQAVLPIENPKFNSRSKEAMPFGDFGVILDLRYQIGAEWGKKPVTADSLKNETEVFQRVAKATARVGGGTSFYLGVFNGKHVMATNHHVMPGKQNCSFKSVQFPLLNITLQCAEFLGHWKDIDLALFVLSTPTPQEASSLAAVARNFNFKEDLMKGQELITIGFGVADNPTRSLVANRDSDCRVFSMDSEYRFLADPDDFNPADYKAWSFANGCDVSHGDSGSAMVDRASGDPIGIIWTGKIPKEQKVQSPEYLDDIYRNNSEDVWKQLSYAVPARKIGDFLKGVIGDPNTDENVAKTLEAILSQ